MARKKHPRRLPKDLEDLTMATSAPRTHIATDAYRDGWDRIFGRKVKVSSMAEVMERGFARDLKHPVTSNTLSKGVIR